jgi:hypothetical protein
VTVAPLETYSSGGLAATMALASTRAMAGAKWFQDNGLALTTVAGNTAFDYDTVVGTVQQPDDDDGNYGNAYTVAGLSLRYLRTHDPAIIPILEAAVQFHIQIEADAVAAYGSFWLGSAPYWYWNSATPSGSLFQSEGGVSSGATDPLFNGGVPGNISYTRGQVRRETSVDQLHMVSLGLYHYLYLLRGETAITANTTLRTNALALLSRMSTFEAAQIPAGSRVIANLYAICTGATPPNTTGITDAQVPSPYWGIIYTNWQVNNGDAIAIAASSNVAVDDFFRALYAPNTSLTAVRHYLQEAAQDMAITDAHQHDVTFSPSSRNTTPVQAYPQGWMLRANDNGNTFNWTSGRTGDDHFLTLTGATWDGLSGRAAQRLIVLCLSQLVAGSYAIPVEQNGQTTLRSIDQRSEIDALALALALYCIEPTTKAQRMSASGWLRKGGFSPLMVDSAFTGYWMMAVELWHLVNAGENYASYYPIGTW